MATKARALAFLLMIGLALASLAPMSQAHECAAHEGCDASNCPDGQDHHHIDYNADTEDEYCRSSSDVGDGSCFYMGIHLPPAVCELLGYERLLAFVT